MSLRFKIFGCMTIFLFGLFVFPQNLRAYVETYQADIFITLGIPRQAVRTFFMDPYLCEFIELPKEAKILYPDLSIRLVNSNAFCPPASGIKNGKGETSFFIIPGFLQYQPFVIAGAVTEGVGFWESGLMFHIYLGLLYLFLFSFSFFLLFCIGSAFYYLYRLGRRLFIK